MGSAVQNIASAKSQVLNNTPVGKSSSMRGIQTKKKNFLEEARDTVENATGIGGGRRVDPIADISRAGREIIANRTPLGIIASQLDNRAESATPSAPSPPTDAENVQKAQIKQYEDYKTALPGMQNQLQSRLSQSMNQDIAKGQRNVEEKNSARGLGYGGINEGQKGLVATQGQQDLASQISGANQGLLDLGNQIQGGAIQTGLGIQGLLQQNADTQYERQRARQSAQNAQNQALLGMLTNAATMAAFA